MQSTQGTLTDFVDKGKSRAVEPGPTAEDDPSHSSGEDELQPRPASRSTTQTQLKFSTSGTSIVPRRLKAKENPSFKVRVDPTMRTLDSMFLPVTREEGEAERKRRRTTTDGEVEEVDMDSSEDEDGVEWMKDENGFAASKDRNVSPGGPIRESKSSLTSVNSMRADVQGARHAGALPFLCPSILPILGRHADSFDKSDVRSCVGNSQGPQVCRYRRLRFVTFALAAKHKTLPHRPCSPSVRPSPTTRHICWSLTSTSIFL